MTDITVKNVDVELLKQQGTWVKQCIDEASGQDQLGIGLLELIDNMTLNAEPKKKEYLVVKTMSVIVEAVDDDDARAKFEEALENDMVSTETTVEEN